MPISVSLLFWQPELFRRQIVGNQEVISSPNMFNANPQLMKYQISPYWEVLDRHIISFLSFSRWDNSVYTRTEILKDGCVSECECFLRMIFSEYVYIFNCHKLWLQSGTSGDQLYLNTNQKNEDGIFKNQKLSR